MKITAKFDEKREYDISLKVDNEISTETIKELYHIASIYGVEKTFYCYPKEKDNNTHWLFKIQCGNVEDTIKLMDAIMHLFS